MAEVYPAQAVRNREMYSGLVPADFQFAVPVPTSAWAGRTRRGSGRTQPQQKESRGTRTNSARTTIPGQKKAVSPEQKKKACRRERARQQLINLALDRLRSHLPLSLRDKKPTKIETLRSAIEYIAQLQLASSGSSEELWMASAPNYCYWFNQEADHHVYTPGTLSTTYWTPDPNNNLGWTPENK